MEKLFELDAYLTRFSARVISCTQGKKGFDIVLDRTAFYPEGGGQPYDTGTLGGVSVLEVHTRNDQIVHTCDGPLEVDSQAEGQINWERRFDLMQQHSGEHIVSGMAHAKYGCDNVGFHLGSDVVTIDLNVELDGQQLAQLEQEVNRYLWLDKPVEILYPTAQELEALDYRSKKAIEGQVRIVTFPGADTCACCGTHVASAGQIGLIKLLNCQKFRDGVRIQLLCGGRALAYLNEVMTQNLRVSNLLSAKMMETGKGVERLLEENQQLKARLAAMEDSRFEQLAQQHRGEDNVTLFEEGLSPDGLRRLCAALLDRCSGRCACFSGSEEKGYQYAIGCPGGDLRPWVKDFNKALNGRGGGKPDFVQGSVKGSREDILQALAQ